MDCESALTLTGSVMVTVAIALPAYIGLLKVSPLITSMISLECNDGGW